MWTEQAWDSSCFCLISAVCEWLLVLRSKGNPSLAHTHLVWLSYSCTVCCPIVALYPGLCVHIKSQKGLFGYFSCACGGAAFIPWIVLFRSTEAVHIFLCWTSFLHTLNAKKKGAKVTFKKSGEYQADINAFVFVFIHYTLFKKLCILIANSYSFQKKVWMPKWKGFACRHMF